MGIMKRLPYRYTVRHIQALEKAGKLHKCEFNPSWGLSYHQCRFCDNGIGQVPHLFKYSIRHYICGFCLLHVLNSHPLSFKNVKQRGFYRGAAVVLALLLLPALASAQELESSITVSQWAFSAVDPHVLIDREIRQERREEIKPFLRWLDVVNLGDAVTTAISLNMGAVERNSTLPQQPAVNFAIQAAEGLIERWAFLKLAETKPRLAGVLVIAAGAFESWVVGHNLGTISMQRTYNAAGRR